MSDTGTSDTGTGDLPPGHPAGTDATVTGGEVLSGRGQGMGGEVPPVPPEDSSGTPPVGHDDGLGDDTLDDDGPDDITIDDITPNDITPNDMDEVPPPAPG